MSIDASICIYLLMECKLQVSAKKVNGKVEQEAHFVVATLYFISALKV
jgi:hypothetical protein